MRPGIPRELIEKDFVLEITIAIQIGVHAFWPTSRVHTFTDVTTPPVNEWPGD